MGRWSTSPPIPLSHLPFHPTPGEGGRFTTFQRELGKETSATSPLSRRGPGGRWERGTGGEVLFNKPAGRWPGTTHPTPLPPDPRGRSAASVVVCPCLPLRAPPACPRAGPDYP